MKQRWLSLIAAAMVLGAAAPVLARFGGPPDWVLQAARQATLTDVGAAGAVVLYSETIMAVDPQGSATRTQRIVLRVLTDDGRKWATSAVPYLQASFRVGGTTAWLIRNGKAVRSSGRGDWMDASLDTFGALYSDSRIKTMSFSLEAAVGDVFAAETEVSGPLLFAEDSYLWGANGLPTLKESYCLELPAGFTVTARWYGEPLPVPRQSVDGRQLTWTLEGQPFLVSEPYAPRLEAVRPMLLARIQPRTGVRFKPVVVQQWNELAQWAQALNLAQCDRNARLTEVAQRLVANAGTDVEKIRALGGYVQGLHYATLLEGLAKGLGFQPHKATQILAQGYGDCKDKANLLCALLREVGIEAFIAAARVDADLPVIADFPSAAQFNHAIVAVRVGPDANYPAVVDTEAGRLLFFDPTSEHTVLGDLPFYLQGTAVFLLKAGYNALVDLPRIAPVEGHRFVRRATVEISGNGLCNGHISVTGHGQAGAVLRHGFFAASDDEARKRFAREQLAESIRASPLQKLVKQDDPVTGVCRVTFEITKGSVTQVLQNSLIVLRPEIFARGPIPALAAPQRQLPVKLPAIAFDDQIDLTLPAEMRPEELPRPVTLSSPYGSYRREFTAAEKTIHLIRRLELTPQMVPAAEYAAVKKFLSDLGKADRASVVLRHGTEAPSGAGP